MSNVSIKEFTDALASKSPAPGGGGAAALVGALGIALGNMVGNLTVGKKKYAGVEADVLALNAKAEKLREELLQLIDEDAAAFEPLAKAYSIPKEAPDRERIMEDALDAAAASPLRIMQKVCEAVELIADYAQKGSALTISDAGCGAAFCTAALESAALNVYINTKAMTDRTKAESINGQANTMLSNYRALAQSIYDNISGRLTNG